MVPHHQHSTLKILSPPPERVNNPSELKRRVEKTSMFLFIMGFSTEWHQMLLRIATHSLIIFRTGAFLVHLIASASSSKISYKIGRRFQMDVSGKFVFSLRLLSSWLISFLSIEQPIYFLFINCLQARVFKRTQNLNPFSSTETMKHGQTAFHKNFCKMTMEMGKGMVMKMSNNVMERVLDRGKSMPYHLCQDSRAIF